MATPNLQERHLDRILSEELETSPDFLDWFLRQVFGSSTPSSPAERCTTIISHNRLDGETDVLVRAAWFSGETAVVHIEDKLDALPQPNQAARYSSAVAAEECTLKASTLVAPGAWMSRHPLETSMYQSAISLEEIAAFFGRRANSLEGSGGDHSIELVKRLRWRESLLNGQKRKNAIYNALSAGDLDAWNEEAAELIAATNGLALEVAPRQRSEGTTKKSRFIRFLDLLTPHQNGFRPIIQLKTAETVRPGRVSFEFRKAGDDSSLKTDAIAAGFEVDVTPAGSLIVSTTAPELRALSIAKSVKEQVVAIEQGANMAQKLIEWWERRFANSAPVRLAIRDP